MKKVCIWILVSLCTLIISSCGNNNKQPNENLENNTIVFDTNTTDTKKVIDNSWLIGVWGPAEFDGYFGEKINMAVAIYEDNILEIRSVTVRTDGSKNREAETFPYTINNEDKTINYGDGTAANSGTIYFDKERQTLNVGREQEPVFIRKNSSTSDSSTSQSDSYSNQDDDNHSNSSEYVDLNSLASVQGYLSGKTFISGDGLPFKVRSGQEVYMKDDLLFGTIVEWYSVKINSSEGRKYLPFKVVSPYNHTEWLFAFYPPDIIRDQEGRNYYLK